MTLSNRAFPYTHFVFSDVLADPQRAALDGLDAEARGKADYSVANGISVGGANYAAADMGDFRAQLVEFLPNFPKVDLVRNTLGIDVTRHEEGRKDFSATVAFEVHTNTRALISDDGGSRLLFAEIHGDKLLAMVNFYDTQQRNTDIYVWQTTIRSCSLWKPEWVR